ncbi:efflux RND transporter permease subunit [Anaerotardibacter muris]|uniref:efflux RND transporter permease subunit n=1 Tax=Anaerotardibacter muris TaxID=2941505 RepID=UPI00204044D9|nr:MMPL family transporter [Anaerotardibacter muris]
MHQAVDKLFRATLDHRKGVLAWALVLCVICALCIPLVKVNYQFADYLPETSPSTQSLEVLEDAFGGDLPNGYIYVQGISLVQAEELAGQFEALDGLSDILWLGDVVDIARPLETYDPDTVKAWRSDDGFLYQVTLDSTKAVAALEEIEETAAAAGASNVALSGDAVNTAVAQGSSDFEIQLIMIMAIAVILGLLLLTSEAWFEPVLFLSVIGISIVYNLGTNIIFGEISFITQMCAAILQLAVSMDYGIVMLHEYRHFKSEGLSSYDAALAGMHKASGVIASSAATTFFGFLSLCVMAFLIGADMGLVLAKGIVFSFLSVLFILPVMVLLSEKLLDRTSHRKLLPSFNKFAQWCLRLSVPFTIVAALVVAPAFLGSRQTEFVYGASGFVEPGSQIYDDTNLIEDTFNASGQWVLLVPEGNWGAERELVHALDELPHVTSVTSYVTTVSERVPTAIVPDESLSQLIAGGYSRIIIGTDFSGESPEAFGLVQAIRDVSDRYYPGTAELVGGTVTSYDMSLIVNDDSMRVLIASIVAIGLVLLVMFRSLSIPLILLFTIELSIWINLAIPYFTGESVQYIGYLIISAIMLGATVDYTIILSRSYLEKRREMPKRPAIIKAISHSAITILTSATILTVCGAFIGIISSNGVIAGLGTLIGRGAFIAALNTFLLLPMLFMLFDRVIEKTTLGAHFYRETRPSRRPGGRSEDQDLAKAQAM